MAIIIGSITDVLLKWLLKLKRYPFTAILSLITILILYEAFDDPIMVIKGFLFAQVLIFAGFYDTKVKIIPDTVHFLIIAISIININPVHAIAGLLAGFLPFLLVGIVCGGIGGADIKLMGASGLVLGCWGVMAASVLGLTIALIKNKFINKDCY